MRKIIRCVLVLSALGLVVGTFSGCGQKEGEGGESGGPAGYQPITPSSFSDGEMNFARIVNSLSRAKVNGSPWAGFWFPYLSGGTSDADSKYERASGAQGSVSWELSHHGSGLPGIQSWWGHCNGWAAASVLSREPRSPKSVHDVSFSVGDQKSLLTEIGMEVTADFFGHRADANALSDPSFMDVYPDQFLLVLANYVGHGFPVIMDRFTGDQVWNQPIAGYSIEPVTREDDLGTDPSSPNVHRVMMTLTVWWLRDDVDEDHVTEGFSFADGASYQSRTLRAEIWLDGAPEFDGSGHLKSSGNVILSRQGTWAYGGVWRNTSLAATNSHPDYLWVPHQYKRSSGFANPYLDIGWVTSHFGG
jgi:hypothetical protein